MRQADVLLSNFKPGTLEALGLDAKTLMATNPRLVMADSSAFGPTGPWAKRLGYGPLVRAATGLTRMWRYPDDPESFSDAVTVYPDHVAGRISALGAVALLVRRERTGRGGTASVSQAEVMLAQFGDLLVPGDMAPPASRSRVLPALGDDEWCAFTVTIDQTTDLGALTDALSIEEWIGTRPASDAAAALQAHGIAAAPMLRVADLPSSAYCIARGSFRVDRHPYLPDPVISESAAAQHRNLPAPVSRPAPLMGEQSAEVVAAWLQPDPDDVKALENSGALQPMDPEMLAAAAAFLAQTPAR